MIDKQIKDEYINALKEIGVDHPIVGTAEVFLETYNGSNEKELKLLFFVLTGLLLNYKEKAIKAEGYDRMHVIKKGMDEEIEEIKETFDNMSNGVLPPKPPVISH